MTKKSRNYSTQKTSLSQFLLIVIIGVATTILAAILPWALNTINPDAATVIPTALSVTPVLTGQTGIFDVYLSDDTHGDFRSTSFTPTQTVYLFFNINDPSGSNRVKSVWSAVDAQGYPPNSEIYRTEDNVTTPGFVIKSNNPSWAIGKFKIELYLNDVLDEIIEFEIVD